jgi:hypothetical protein
MIRFAWLGFGLIGALVAVLSGGVWWVAVFGGAVTAVSIVLQYLDAKPFDRIVAPREFVEDATGGSIYQETSWHANGRVSINIFVKVDGKWTEAEADNGIGPKGRFWVRVAVNNQESLRVVAR